MPVPALCTIDQRPGNGGIARVSTLLWQVMQDMSAERCALITLMSGSSQSATLLDKTRFASKVVAGQLKRNFSWLMFDHLALTSTQRLVPAPYRRPYGVFLHSVEVWDALSATKLDLLKRATVRIANSNYTVQRTVEAHGAVGNIDVCHLALPPTDSLSAEVSAPGRAADGAILQRMGDHAVLIVGRMLYSERHKGHEQLIRVWPSVKTRVPDARLVIVGRGDDKPRLQNLARQTGHGESILFTDWVDDATLSEIYRRAAVFAMPSKGEGFGLVFLEAMKYRLPCIASLHDASREIVSDGQTGFLVDQADADQLSRSIATLLIDRNLRLAMGAAGFQRLASHFSFTQFKRRIITCLEPLSSGRQAGELQRR